MDTGRGYMISADNREDLEDHRSRLIDALRGKSHHDFPIWEIGQEVEINGSRLKVTALGSRFITFKILSGDI